VRNPLECARRRSTQEVVLLRSCCGFGEKRALQALEYAKALDGYADFWLVYDTSRDTPDSLVRIEADMRATQDKTNASLNILLYNLNLLNRLYPMADDIREEKKPLYWVSELTATAWYHLCGHHNWGDTGMIPENPHHVWLVQSDVGFTGNPRDFFNFYADKDYDFIDARIKALNDANWEMEMTIEHWIANKKGLVSHCTLSDKDITFKTEFVQRFSSRLLYHIKFLVMHNFPVAGEIFTSTLCTKVLQEWCKWRSFDDDGFAGEKLKWDTFVSNDEWEAYNKNESTRNKWYHSVVVYKDKHHPFELVNRLKMKKAV
jgi:hypothetical protein